MKQTTPTPLKELREIKNKAKARRMTLPGMLKRARNLVWIGWLWFLVWLAEWNWKTWTIFIVLLVLTIIAYILVPVEESPKYGLDHDFALDSPEFLPSITGATDTPFLPGNKIDIYNNGDEFYPVMLAEIERASRSITVEAYIYWGGEIGMKFAQAFAARRRAGVTVKLLLDAVGSSTIGDDILEVLEGAGCEVKWYRPIHWYTINRINNRTHRKSLIIDGRVGFTGGAGIADHWLGHAQDPDHWRDIQIRIEGPAVTPLQSAFSRNWLETTGELVSGEPYYPQQEAPGTLAVQSILSWPETGSSTVRVMYYLSIVCARKSIFIANPYFVPDDQAIEILINAKRRGVDVKIMVAGVHNDNILARRNSTRLYGPLLEAGVEIYEYQKTMLHHKFMVCDGLWATIGTTNFDARSFAHNDENNVCTYDRDFASRWVKIFQDDLAGCERITLEKWRDRGLLVKAAELLASLLKSQV
jgi:cardiolipin synthase